MVRTSFHGKPYLFRIFTQVLTVYWLFGKIWPIWIRNKSYFWKKVFFGEVMTERKTRILRIQYMATWCDGTIDVNMTSFEVVCTCHRIRRFLRRSLVLKINPNTGQTPGTTDKIERRKIMAKSEGRSLLNIDTLKALYCCIEMPLCGTNATHYVPKL